MAEHELRRQLQGSANLAPPFDGIAKLGEVLGKFIAVNLPGQHLPGQHLAAIDCIVVQSCEFANLSQNLIGDDGVGVQLGIKGAGSVMPEQPCNELAVGDLLHTTIGVGAAGGIDKDARQIGLTLLRLTSLRRAEDEFLLAATAQNLQSLAKLAPASGQSGLRKRSVNSTKTASDSYKF